MREREEGGGGRRGRKEGEEGGGGRRGEGGGRGGSESKCHFFHLWPALFCILWCFVRSRYSCLCILGNKQLHVNSYLCSHDIMWRSCDNVNLPGQFFSFRLISHLKPKSGKIQKLGS